MKLFATLFSIFLVFSIFIISCSDSQKNQKSDFDALADEETIEDIQAIYDKYDTFPKITYSRVYIENREQLHSLWKKFEDTKANFPANKAFITLNRKARHYMKVGDTVLVPDEIYGDMRYYSVFPQYYHGAKNIPKLVIVSNIYQCWAAYEYGVQVRFAPANTGKEKTQTYPGRYALVWKQIERRSSLDETWVMPYTWNFHNWAGSAFHQFTMPGYPASHSCVRQFEDDAKWLFNWGERAKLDSNKKFIHLSGTPVIIIDAYDFSIPKNYKWLKLSSNKDLVLELPEKPMEVEEAYIPISQIPEDARGSLKNKQHYLVAEDTLRARGVIREGVGITPSINFNKLRKEKAKKDAEKRKKDSLKQLELLDLEEASELYKTDPQEEEIE